MLKRAIFWILYLIFVGGLVWGAINRTSSVLEENSENHNVELSREIENLVSQSAIMPSKDAVADTHEKGWEILSGKISVLNNRGAVVTLENGLTISLNPRSWRFAQTQGLQAQLGDSLLLTGFYENGKFEVAHLRNLDNGTVAQIRDEDGHPLWVSGGGGE